MIIPRFWAEARRQRREGGRQVTVRRFGWSDASDADAQAMADRRADEALEQAWVDKRIVRRERKVPYLASEALPIREQIVARHGEAIVTRNGYGARCLNTPDVCFVDIDLEPKARARLGWLLLVAAAIVVAGFVNSMRVAGIVAAVAFFVAGAWWLEARARRQRAAEGPHLETVARERVRAFVAARPAWHARVYATPAGLRVLLTHDTFDPKGLPVRELFEGLDADLAYRRLCAVQGCFRARLTAKPWRIGMTDRLRPRPGVWPVAPERMPERERWVTRYEATAQGYAACRFVEAIGSGDIHPKVAPVLDLHDLESGALTQRPLA